VEDELMKPEALEVLLKCFTSAKANSFGKPPRGSLPQNLLDFHMHHNIGIAKSQFFKRVIDRLAHSEAVV
jgi:hypothetical protein